ncbi:MAG: hypothetical protein K0R09_2217 [Clostridiales bacterium]|jgi:DNA helicase-2/ATP-dependent DNA helicase PcrA|nr:hypothetical protein [Clostridiales bacterium]
MYDKFFKHLKDKHNIKLNQQQRDAAVHKDGPCLVLAVPGAGKTTVLITRLAILTSIHGVDPKSILCLTFSRASASDMKERYRELFSDIAPEGITFSTIHSFALSVIRNYENITGKKYKIIEDMKDRINKVSMLKGIYREINNEYIGEDAYEELVNKIGYVKNAMLDIETYKDSSINNFDEIYKKYNEEKSRHGYIDYDDMLTLSYKILNENSSLLEFYRNRYKYILVDEAQDSSLVQNKVIELIASPRNNIYMVGDDDQSIYGFRAADPSQMLNFSSTYNGAKLYFMEQNFRSTENIVRLADKFIKANEKRYNKNLKSDREAGGRQEVVEVEDEKEQLELIIQRLNKLQSKKVGAILYRNNLSAVPLVDAFDRRGIKFYMKDSKGGLLKYRVTQDVLAILSVSLNKFDRDSFERIYFKVNSYLSKEVISYIKSLEENVSVFDGVRKCPQLSKWQKDKFREFEGRFKELSYKSPNRAINYILYQLGYKDYLNKSSSDKGESIQSYEMVLAALESIADNTSSIAQFMIRIQDIETLMEESKYNKNKDAVTLTTIHSAKGLEFDTCFIVDAINGVFPYCESQIEPGILPESDDYEEERRLFYVGMTRAKNNLYIFDIKSWNGQFTQISDFIKAIRKIMEANGGVGRIILKDFESSMVAPNPLNININPGNNVYHTSFGYGKVISIEKDTIVVDFNNSGIKKMLLSLCINEKKLRICG